MISGLQSKTYAGDLGKGTPVRLTLIAFNPYCV